MASRFNRLFNKSSVSSLRSAALRSSTLNPSSAGSAAVFRLPSKSSASSVRRFSFSRCPSELGCVQSLLPLHSTVAASRLTSCLSTTSRSCRALSQGT